ncbi:hypothetical protein AKJ63_01770 [candidate division MSBL1 archaeon SCGC-AAA259D18]|uniref:Uroporphyrinogen decarboxylase (URO-D) domain-containing protein n=1 Tax=candidate division MSBL1 archaeon SCGC-AAA259D18 TaxID=1698262 RepID=A0A133UAJ2_9EURY|nr:hypothetical protein AKJ63_01770 [candidate division MSBL1 archaeon SCGC-AAA259D18]
MKPRERVLKAINLEKPDRIPIDLGSTNCTSMTVPPYEKVKEKLSIDAPTKLMMKNFQLAEIDERVLEELKIDTRAVHGFSASDAIKEEISKNVYINQFGIKYKRPSIGERYDMVEHPLDGVSLEEYEEEYVWPEPEEEKIVQNAEERARKLYEEDKYAIVGDVVESGIFEPSWYIRGMQNFLIDLIRNKEYVHKLLSDMLEFQIKRYEIFLDRVGEYLDIVFVGDDLATTDKTLMSKDTYREMVKPYQKKYFDNIKSMTDAKLLYHSDGNIVDFLDDLVEIGIDILNPIETSALDLNKLKEFEDDLCFWGGIDNIEVLPNGTKKDVKQEVKKRIHQLGPNGYVLASVHNIQADVPAENALTMFRTAPQVKL